jgi:deferrochelatase/peroxidase EfeB
VTRVVAGQHLSRRGVLTGAIAGVAGAGMGTGGALVAEAHTAKPVFTSSYGAHQAGIVTPPLPYLSIAGLDVVGRTRDELALLLRTWTRTAAQLTSAGGLTLTFGFGPALFAAGRFGLAERRPASLAPLPPFPGEAIDRRASDGDLCVQACATDPTTAHEAVRALVNAGRAQAALRWRQNGFRPEPRLSDDHAGDPRGLFGFRDGTANLDVHNPAEAAAHLWVDTGPAWLHGGTFLVVRRIRLLLDTWDRTGVADQEAVIGRRRDTNERLEDAPGAHAPLASPERNGGARLHRRPYSYDAGVDPNGLLDSGLIFLCYQQDPLRQFVPIQRRLAGADPLNGFSQHVASGLFACPPGCSADSWIGEELLS